VELEVKLNTAAVIGVALPSARRKAAEALIYGFDFNKLLANTGFAADQFLAVFAPVQQRSRNSLGRFVQRDHPLR
jgi:hypothetical protein